MWRVQARDGVYWAKQSCPSQSFEGDLTPRARDLAPHRMLEPVAVRDDGAFLLPDGGPDDLDAWCHVVGEWARGGAA